MNSADLEKQLKEEKMMRSSALEREYQMWEKRREELRKVSLTALDQAFVRRNIDRCSKEMERISKMLAGI